MEQSELENRVKDIFEEQGFDIEKDGNQLTASVDSAEKSIQIFSSGSYDLEDIEREAEPGALVFVDEELSGIAEELENEVSVIQGEGEEPEYELPSYEMIGDIAVINELSVPEDEAVEGIRAHNPRVKTILLKDEPLSGEYRVGEYETLYGEETETVHKEFGCRYRVDVTEAYFSERLATERKRIADRANDGESVLVIGAGVGPYPILIASEAEPEKMVAVEKNPRACDYLEENIGLNDVEDIVEAVCGDAKEVIPEEEFDRVIVAVPEFGEEFLEIAFQHARQNGVIHYYSFLEDENWEELEEDIDSVGQDYEVIDRAVCGQRGPSVERVCLDIRT